MDKKSIAAAKRASLRRDRVKYWRSQRASSSSGAAAEKNIWDGFDQVLPLEDVEIDGQKIKSRGLDYGELLAQDPFYSYTALPPRSSEVLDDAIADIYSQEDSEGTNLADFLALDLEKLSERLASVSLAKRLFLEQDETLPSELFAGDEASARDEELQLSGSDEKPDEKLERNEWLNTVVNDPGDGEAVKLSDGDDEQIQKASSGVEDRSEKRVAEEELDSLLDLLGKVTIELSNEGGGRDLMMNIDAGAREPAESSSSSSGGQQNFSLVSSLMPREELDALFWSPDSSSKPGTAASEEQKLEQSKPSAPAAPAEDDFDAWLDSLDD